MSNDDWKGEHLIRSSVTERDRGVETKRLKSVLYHEARRKRGEKMPAAARHEKFITMAVFRGKNGEH